MIRKELYSIAAASLAPGDNAPAQALDTAHLGVTRYPSCFIVEFSGIAGGAGDSVVKLYPRYAADAAKQGSGILPIFADWKDTAAEDFQTPISAADPGSGAVVYPSGVSPIQIRGIPPFVYPVLNFAGTAYTGGTIKVFMILD